tara:strand:- start:7938 stop:8324 length:387 start_codon:yes stop_codon:yes gene_type:complete
MNSFYKLMSFNLVVIFVYAIIYQQIKTQFYGLDDDSSFIDCLYFSFSIQSTVGFGDLGPKTKIAKIIVMSQQLILISEISGLFVNNSGLDSKQLMNDNIMTITNPLPVINNLVGRKVLNPSQIFSHKR